MHSYDDDLLMPILLLSLLFRRHPSDRRFIAGGGGGVTEHAVLSLFLYTGNIHIRAEVKRRVHFKTLRTSRGNLEVGMYKQ